MISVINHFKGKTEVIEFDKLNLLRGLNWIDCVGPSLRDLNRISERVNVPINTLKHCVDPRERPRVQNEKEYSLIILKALSTKNKGTKTITLGIVLTKRYLITIRSDEISAIDLLKEYLLKKENKSVFQINLLVYRLFVDITRSFSKAFELIEDELDQIEEDLLGGISDIKDIFSLRKVLLFFRKALVANRDVASNIERGLVPLITVRDIFNDIYIEIMQLIDTEELVRGRLVSVLEVYLSSLSNRTNDIMKSFTVIASLLLLPMLIGTVYGMNIVLPISKNQNAFYVLLSIMIVSMFIMMMFFKKKRWL